MKNEKLNEKKDNISPSTSNPRLPSPEPACQSTSGGKLMVDRRSDGGQAQPLAEVWPPCQVACPVHADVQKYVGLLAQGRAKEALDVIRETILFAAICGRICPHPCEDVCRRSQVEEPIAIASLKRFAADVSYPSLMPARVAKKIGKKIAIIGAGPAGLTAAYDLAELGYKVVVFEKLSEPGGMLRYGVPRYRLPTKALMQDVKLILDAGVELKTGVEIGKDMNFDEFKKQGFDAILISVGLSASKGLDIPGSNLEGILLAIPFLCDINLGKKVEIGKKVIVIGGGDVAMDAARTVIRLGAKEVDIACLECGDEIPAHSWELEEALEEGAKLHSAKGPKRFLGKDGNVTGVEFMEVKSVFDEQGRFCPTFYEDKTCLIEGDTVILAIGQASELSFLEKTSVGLTEGKELICNSDNLSTKKRGVFACGEVVTGPGAAIEAIASGHKAALAIDTYLKQKRVSLIDEETCKEVGELKDKIAQKIKKNARERMPTVRAGERIKNFDQFELGYEEAQAAREAQRCLSCTRGAEVIKEKCTACLACIRVCPFDVPYIEKGEFAGVDASQCQSCGICPSECPTKAIKLKFASEDEIIKQVGKVLKQASSHNPKSNILNILSIICQYGYYLLKDAKGEMVGKEDIAQVRVLCTARIGTDTLLKFFELGAKGVIVATCKEEDCRYGEGSVRTMQRVRYVKELLGEVGISKESLQICSISSKFEEGKESFEEALDKVKKSLGI